jgi:mRNA interferase RelE/StbE
MAEYAVTFARSARNELEALDAPLVTRIVARIEALAVQPRPPGVRKLRGAENQWRLRVGGYRVVYEIDDRRRTIDIVRIRHRREVYR